MGEPTSTSPILAEDSPRSLAAAAKDSFDHPSLGTYSSALVRICSRRSEAASPSVEPCSASPLDPPGLSAGLGPSLCLDVENGEIRRAPAPISVAR
eukprot:scaffold1077_cov388-Prasinococcus_capsulatus_cf.AAC.13